MRSRRIDEIPRLLMPIFLFYSYALAILLFGYVRLVHLTSRIEFTGDHHLTTDNQILCHWHTFIPVYFAVFAHHDKHAWMQHPAWFMKPIHIVIRWLGIERIVLGSAGHGGRRAADELVELLANGYSTVVFPDGPAGPPRVLKKGVIHMSQQSNVAVVPVHFTVSRSFELPTWDRKIVPLPFGRIDVAIGEPLRFGDMGIEKAAAKLEATLDGES